MKCKQKERKRDIMEIINKCSVCMYCRTEKSERSGAIGEKERKTK